MVSQARAAASLSLAHTARALTHSHAQVVERKQSK